MTSPTEFSTPARIIRQAYENAEIIEKGTIPDGELMASGMNRLNDLINLWQTQGLKLWLNVYRMITLVAGTGSYTLGPAGTGAKTMRVLEGYYIDSNSNSRPLIPMSWSDWGLLSNKSDTGAVTSYFIDKQYLNTVVWFWLIPDAEAATGTAQLLTQVPVTNLVSLTDTMNFPVEWFMALHWGLADELCTGQPQAVQQRCAMRAEAFRKALEDWDVEDVSTTFGVDTQQRSGSSFR